MEENKSLISKLQPFFRLQFPYFFISLFAAFCFAWLYQLSFSSDLNSFNQRMIGICTLENINASSRISFFYNSLFIIVIAFFLCNAFLNFLKNKGKIHESESLILSWISIAGISSFLFQVSVGTGIVASYLSLLLFIPVSIVTVCRTVFKRHPHEDINIVNLFLWTFLVSSVITSVLLFLFSSSDSENKLSFVVTDFTIFTTVIIFLYIFRISSSTLNRLIYSAKPLAWLPLLIVVSSELALILNQRAIPISGSTFIFAVSLITVLFFCASRYTKKISSEEFSGNLITGYFPVLIAGFVSITLWQPALSQVTDMFELANPANALMRIYSFKELPVLQFLSSHIASDILPGFIYFLLNGFDGTTAFIHYNFIEFIFVLIILFWFTGKITGDYKVSFILCLLFPFVSKITDESTILSLILIFLLVHVYKKSSFTNLFLFWFVLLFISLYSPDLGTTSIIALTLTAIFTPSFFKSFPVRKILLSAGISAITVCGIILILSALKGVPVYSNFHQAFLYLSANQSHGASDVLMMFNRDTIIEYAVIPVVMMSLLIYVLFKRNTLFERNNFIFFSFVFMIFFYFAYFQRGLLRHGFNEGHDGFLATFSFLTLSLSPYLIFNTKEVYKHLLFFLSAFFLIWQFTFSDPKGSKNLFTELTETSFSKFNIKASLERTERIYNADEGFTKSISLFKEFCKNNLKSGQTFGDISNSPMLYYYSQKQVPSYFCQGIQNIVTDRQQQYYLDDLHKYDIPFFVVSNVPQNWFDATDNVPNFLRYYRISEFLFVNYHPWSIVGGRTVWLRNDISYADTIYTPDTIARKPATYDLMHLPEIWATYESDHDLKLIKSFEKNGMTINNNESFTVFIDSTFASEKGNYIDLEISYKGAAEPEYILDYGRDWVIFGEFHFNVRSLAKNGKYRIRVSTQYNWYDKKVNFVRVRPAGGEKGADVLSISILQAD